MMDGTRPRHTNIVIGRNGIDHIGICPRLMSQLKGTTYDTSNVLHVVGTVKLCILRQYLCLNELYQIKTWMSYGSA